MATEFGKYVLQRKLAEGGMAEVFLAKQAGLEGFEKPVVVKRILPHLTSDESFVQMFLNEARVAARLSHPSIVQIFDLGKVDDQYYIAMEFIHGEDLRTIAKQAEKTKNRPSFALVARIVADMLGALHYAHTRTGPDGKPLGLVHRDISPQNVLVTYDGGVKLVDFGIAKATESPMAQQTQAGLLKGKYSYMSPEQCRGRRVDARSDVFSVGILLWELITWRRLFRRDTDLATLVAVADEAVPTLTSIRSDVPAELDRICMRALDRDLRARYPSAQAMQSDLEALIRNSAWEADHIALQVYVRSLFAEKLRLQDDAVRAAGLGSLDDFLVRVEEGTAMAWMEAKNATNQTPGVAMPFKDADADSGPVPLVEANATEIARRPDVRTADVQRVLPPRPGEAFVIAPIPRRPDAEDENTSSTMRHAVGQQFPARSHSTLQGIALHPPQSGIKRFVIVTFTGLALAAAVLTALFWGDLHPVAMHRPETQLATLRVLVDAPAAIFVDGRQESIGKQAEVQVAAQQSHEVRARSVSGVERKEQVKMLDPGAVFTVRIRFGKP